MWIVVEGCRGSCTAAERSQNKRQGAAQMYSQRRSPVHQFCVPVVAESSLTALLVWGLCVWKASSILVAAIWEAVPFIAHCYPSPCSGGCAEAEQRWSFKLPPGFQARMPQRDLRTRWLAKGKQAPCFPPDLLSAVVKGQGSAEFADENNSESYFWCLCLQLEPVCQHLRH